MSDLASLLAEQGIRPRSFSAGEKRQTCPQCSASRTKHPKDPCLAVAIGPCQTSRGAVEDGTAVWHCHHCDWKGSVSIRARRSDQPYQARRREYKRPSFKPEAPTLPEQGYQWFENRKISRQTVDRNGITMAVVWMPQFEKKVPAMAFPYRREPGGEVVNVKYRRGPGKNFRQEKDAEKILYGMDTVPADATELIWVEGECDKLALNEAGIWNVVSVPDGAPKDARPDDEKIDPESDAKFEYVWNCHDFVGRFERHILAFDADGPGQALEVEISRRLGREICWRVTWPSLNDVQLKDANEVLVEEGAEVLRECVERAQPYPIRSLFQADQYQTDVVRLFDGLVKRGRSTGLPCLDAHYTVRLGELTVVTGIPSSGKSEFVDWLSIGLAEEYGWKFAVCSFENPPDEHIAKLIQKRARAPFYDGPNHRMSAEQRDAAMEWINHHFYFIRADDDAPTIDWILDTAKAAVMRHGIQGLIIDPYNEIAHHRPGGMREDEYISEMLGKVKRFNASHDVHTWFVAHPSKLERNRDGTFPQVTLYNIAGGAQWANKADCAIVVHRDYNDDGSEKPVTQIQVKKVRFRVVGRPGVVSLDYNPVSGRYEELPAA